MFEQKVTKQTICNIIDGAIILGVPIIYTEQYPAGLGSTIKDVDRRIKREPRFEKTTFSCLGDNIIALDSTRFTFRELSSSRNYRCCSIPS